MNQEQLNAIKERVAKATPGPWESEGTLEGHNDIFNPDEAYVICQTGNENYDCLNDGDTEFIKHAITDVPALVAEVERLREALSYYADASRYGSRTDYQKYLHPILEDYGEIARQALDGEAHDK